MRDLPPNGDAMSAEHSPTVPNDRTSTERVNDVPNMMSSAKIANSDDGEGNPAGELFDPQSELDVSFTYLGAHPQQRQQFYKSRLLRSRAECVNRELQRENHLPLFLTREEALEMVDSRERAAEQQEKSSSRAARSVAARVLGRLSIRLG